MALDKIFRLLKHPFLLYAFSFISFKIIFFSYSKTFYNASGVILRQFAILFKSSFFII
jgi:hypothetical protein